MQRVGRNRSRPCVRLREWTWPPCVGQGVWDSRRGLRDTLPHCPSRPRVPRGPASCAPPRLGSDAFSSVLWVSGSPQGGRGPCL